MADTSPSGTLRIGGQDRPFALDAALEAAARALHHRRDEHGHPLSAAGFRRAFGPEALRAGLVGEDARDYLYAALVAGYTWQRAPVDFSYYQVGQWLADSPELAAPFWATVAAALPVVKAAAPARKAAAK